MKLDETLVARVLGDFAALIKGAAESTARSRFSVIEKLARQATDFQLLNSTRVGEFDDPMQTAQNGGIIMGNVAYGGGFNDQAEMMRTLIDSLKDMGNRRSTVSPASELSELLAVRRTLKQDGETTEDIDIKITQLRKEIANGSTSAVVHPQLLRGSSSASDIPGDDETGVGERDADGAPSPGVAAESRSEEGLDGGHGARSDEGFLQPQG